MELEITPPPSDEEREAIAAAIGEAQAAEAPEASFWREASLREATGSDDEA